MKGSLNVTASITEFFSLFQWSDVCNTLNDIAQFLYFGQFGQCEDAHFNMVCSGLN